MQTLLLACVSFVASHFLLSGTPLRALLARLLGERLYLGFYSLLAIWLLIWMGLAYGAAPYVRLWPVSPALLWVPLLVMPFALLLIVGGYLARNPTAVMQEPGGTDGKPAGIFAVTRHPILWGFALWALAHIAARGDLASLVLFGSIAILSLGGTLALDAKKRRAWGERWAPFARRTSNLPFRAIADGRARFRPGEFGVWRLLTAIALFALLIWAHPRVLGVSALPF
ncbi:MAG: NnrU family protein [Dongiaceae bacterium]